MQDLIYDNFRRKKEKKVSKQSPFPLLKKQTSNLHLNGASLDKGTLRVDVVVQNDHAHHDTKTENRCLGVGVLGTELRVVHRIVADSGHRGEGKGHILLGNGVVLQKRQELDPSG